MKLLYSAQNIAEADTLRHLLGDEGVEAIIQDSNVNVVDVSAEAPTAWRVLVDEQCFDAASGILARYLEERDSPTSNALQANASSSEMEFGGELSTPKHVLRLWIELLAALVLMHPFYSPPAILIDSRIAPLLPESFAGVWSNYMLFYTSMSAGAFAIIWWSGESWSSYGLRRPRWSVDAVTCCLVVFMALLLSAMVAEIIAGIQAEMHYPRASSQSTEIKEWFGGPNGIWGLAALVTLTLAIGFAEELLSRGIVLTRIQRLSGSRVWAVTLSAAIFGGFHWQSGAVTVSATCMMGLVFGVVFVWTGRLWPLIIAHAIVDLGYLLGQFPH